jgi:hypothetical protein
MGTSCGCCWTRFRRVETARDGRRACHLVSVERIAASGGRGRAPGPPGGGGRGGGGGGGGGGAEVLLCALVGAVSGAGACAACGVGAGSHIGEAREFAMRLGGEKQLTYING